MVEKDDKNNSLTAAETDSENTKPNEEAAVENINAENAENPEASAEDDSAMITLRENLKEFSDLQKNINRFWNIFGIPEMALLRFIAAFFTISAMNVVEIKGKLYNGIHLSPISNWKDFVPLVNGKLTVTLIAVIFAVLTLIFIILPKRYRITDQCFAIAAILYFDVAILWRANNFNLSLGVMIVSVVLIYYALGKMKSQKLFNKIPWWICGIIVFAAAAAVSAFVGITTVYRHKIFGTNCFDFGIFVQMFHSLIDNGTAVTTCERDMFMSHFKVHASYIFYALVPIFKMFPKPETLLIAQAVLSMGGIVPMFLIAKRHKLKGLSLVFMGLAYVFSIGLIAPCYYEFHENAFLPTVLMWLLWAVDRKNYIMFYIMSVLTCIVKEDAPLYVICIGMYLFFEEKGKLARMNGLIMALFSGAYMLFITNWLTQNGDGQMMMSSRFSILMIDTSAGLKEVVKNSLADPAYLFSLLICDNTFKFFIQVMAPMLFVPFFTKNIRRFWLMVPFIVMNLIIGAGYIYAPNVEFQYIFGPICLLLYMCIINLDEMSQRGKQNVPVILGAAAFIMTIGTCSHNWHYYEGYQKNKDYYIALESLLDSIPKDAAVGADGYYVPHIADHKELYLFDTNDYDENGKLTTPEKFDFVAISAIPDTFGMSADALTSSGYTLWAEIKGKCQVYKSPDYVTLNNAE